MNKFLFPILALILAACVSSSEGSSAPQVTVAPEATSTSTPPPTETPLPTLTPTPVAVNGIAENAEGDKLAFLNGEWRMLPELDADYASMRVDVNGSVVAVDADGEVAFEYDMVAQNWAEVEKSYPSCAMPELIAEQDAGFTERTGIDLDNLGANSQGGKFQQALSDTAYVGFRQEQGVRDVVDFSMIKTGVDLVSVGDVTGGIIDRLLCVYGRNAVIPNETLVYVAGWVDTSGNFVNLSFGADATNLNSPVGITSDKQLDFFRNLPDGAMLTISVHTFAGIGSIDEVNSVSPPPSPNQERVREFLRAMNGGMIGKFSAVSNISEYWALQNPSEGDVGLLPAGDWKLVRLEDISP